MCPPRCRYCLASVFFGDICDECESSPGLRQVGPAPWDYVYVPTIGQRIGFIGMDGEVCTDVITDIAENRETGEIKLTTSRGNA